MGLEDSDGAGGVTLATRYYTNELPAFIHHFSEAHDSG
jgi:hypothetical protein